MIGALMVFLIEDTFAIMAHGHRADICARFNAQNTRHNDKYILNRLQIYVFTR